MEEIEAARAESGAALQNALAGRPALLTRCETATRLARDAQHEFQVFAIRLRRATCGSQDGLAPVLARILDNLRAKRDSAAAAATLAKRHLANLDWAIECRRAELQQLDFFENPPPDPDQRSLAEVVKRPEPSGLAAEDDDDVIVFPGRERRRDASA
jgi:hypothetical protein